MKTRGGMALPAGLARRDGANTGHNVGVSEADWGNLAEPPARS
jgi:hypothetical protein